MTASPDLSFAQAYHALTMLVAATPRLMGFAGWPLAVAAARPAHVVPAASLVKEWADDDIPAHAALNAALRALCDLANWQQTYSEAEVGADFLARYGYFELVGPTGHYRTDAVRAYIAYWGGGLVYPWHVHEAEELYYILAGEAVFEAERRSPMLLRAGDTTFHAPWQPHAMTTGVQPVLALVLWRGAGIDGLPRMGRA